MSESQEIRGSDRVHIDKDVHPIYQELAERSSQKPESAPFFTMKDVFMWALALGVRAGRQRPLSDAKIQIFRWDQFSQFQDIPALKAVALAQSGKIEILVHQDEILRVAEEYANEGIHELWAHLNRSPGERLWNLSDIART